MIDPLDNRYRPFLLFLSRKRRGAFFVLTLEKIICHSWRLTFWCLFFAGLWMLALPAFLGPAASILALIIFLLGGAYFTHRDILNFSFPEPDAIDDRLEENSKLGRGHIALIEDQLANPAIISTRLLWHKAQRDGLIRLKKLRIPGLHTRLSKKDPHALRFIALLVFVSGAFVAGHNWQERIIKGLMPVIPSLTISQVQNTDLWINPPDYTQMPEMHISGTSGYTGKLNIPEGSTYRIRMRSRLGALLTPHLHMLGINIPMTYMEDSLYGIEGIIQPGKKLRITQGLLPRVTWPYRYIVDTPPEIRSDIKTPEEIDAEETTEGQTEPKASFRYEILDDGQIRFPLVVKDDYGVKDLHMHMRLDEMLEDAPLGEDSEEMRLIMSHPGDEFKIAPIYDMTWHSWAGLPVTFEFTATDQKGQSTTLDKISLTLPERSFKHPMAQALIAARKALAWNHKGPLKEIALNLERLLDKPSLFQDNPVVFLAIRTAASRLYHNDDKPEKQRLKAAKEVIKLLWDTALVVEEGDLMLALRELRDAQRALENAMRDPNTDQQEIQALMDELREKMVNYFTEIHREMQKRMAQGENMPFTAPEDFGALITPDTLANLMAQIEQAMRDGNEQEAQELMSQLQRMMEMIDPTKGATLPQDMQMMREGINELQKLIERQEALIEQTEEQASEQRKQGLGDNNKQQNRPGNTSPNITPRDLPALEQMLKDFGMDNVPPAPEQDKPKEEDKAQDEQTQPQIDTSANKTEQDALRYILGQLMMDVAEKLDNVPENMGNAEQEMRGSAEELGKNNPDQSLPHQNKAVKHLKDAQEQLAQSFRQRMQQMIGIGLSGTGQQLDPLGRPYNNEGNGQDVDSQIKVPDEAQQKRADEIIRQLRQRSGDRSRTREELEYYRRLLRQF